MTLLEILQGAHVALLVIQARLVVIITLIFTFSLYAWAMWLESTLAFMICAVWGLTIFLPVLYTGRGGLDDAPTERAERREDGTQA